MHCNADLIIYFGSDLSSSSSTPLIIAPRIKRISVSTIESILNNVNAKFSHENNDSDIILFYEAAYHNDIELSCKFFRENKRRVILAKLPACADLQNWSPFAIEDGTNDRTEVVIGGLSIESILLEDLRSHIVYIGDNQEQLINILLRLGDRVVHWGLPSTAEVTAISGSSRREFQERYSCSLRVKDAKIVGLIIGSMGLTGEVTTTLVRRLELLLQAAGKKSYCVVIGRLNEAKLCNFPEVAN